VTSQADVRTWAREQGFPVKTRGTLPAEIVQAYAAAHGDEGVATTAAAPRASARRRAAAPERGRASRPGAPRSRPTGRGATPAARSTEASQSPSPVTGTATAKGSLAGGLRSLLDSMEREIGRVSALSEHIDDIVTRLNARRAEQAARLEALDELRGASPDPVLTQYLDEIVQPRTPQVQEVVPDRLRTENATSQG
jgi:hypothetical protein